MEKSFDSPFSVFSTESDEPGNRAVEEPCTVYDLWATVLHLIGTDHEQIDVIIRWLRRSVD